MEQPPKPLTNEDLLAHAERYFGYARNNYGKEPDGNEHAEVAALIAQAAASIVIARTLTVQTELMQEVQLPEIGGEQ